MSGKLSIRETCIRSPGLVDGAWDVIATSDASCTLERAERELARVHAVELAFLLRDAAMRRFDLGEFASGHRLLERSPMPIDAWRSAFDEELAMLDADGLVLEADVAGVVELCRAADPVDWPISSDLAAAALRVQEHELGRVRLAQGLLADQRPAVAAVVARTILAREPSRAARALALEAAATAGELLGDLDRSLRCHVRAARCAPPCSPVHRSSLVSTLFLALAKGDRARVLEAVDAIERWSSGALGVAAQAHDTEIELRRRVRSLRSRVPFAIDRALTKLSARLARGANPMTRAVVAAFA